MPPRIDISAQIVSVTEAVPHQRDGQPRPIHLACQLFGRASVSGSASASSGSSASSSHSISLVAHATLATVIQFQLE